MATPFAAGNWKMNTTLDEAVALAQEMRGPLSALTSVIRVVCPPYVSLAAVAAVLKGGSIAVGAQDLHPEPKGAFTGAVSGTMLQGLCQYVIVGHSERRHIFGETDELVNQKLLAAIGLDLTPILCVGETLEERQAGRAKDVVSGQVRQGLRGYEHASIKVVVAYEPVWAIGTGHPATDEAAQEMMGMVRQVLGDEVGPEAAAEIPLLYGGSVTAKNVAQYARQADIDGALVGGASLRAEEFVAIVREIAEARAAIVRSGSSEQSGPTG